MLKSITLTIAVMMAVPLASATPHHIKPKAKKVVVVPAKYAVPAHRVVIVKTPAPHAYRKVQTVRPAGYVLKQLDRIENRIEARENRRGRRH